IGIMDAASFRKKRFVAWFILCVFAAMVTPSDALSMLMLMIPMWGLYELGILMVQYSAPPPEPVPDPSEELMDGGRPDEDAVDRGAGWRYVRRGRRSGRRPYRAANSAARVPSSHGGSHWFESSAAHLTELLCRTHLERTCLCWTVRPETLKSAEVFRARGTAMSEHRSIPSYRLHRQSGQTVVTL